MDESPHDKILIVEDSPEMIDLLLSLLPAQTRRSVATSAEQAINLLTSTKKPPDLILLDVILPGINGYQACRQIKENSRLSEIPVIFISSLQEAFDKVMAFQAGAVDYIAKPFQADELRARVQTHLKLRQYQKQLVDLNRVLEQRIDDKAKELTAAQMATLYALVRLAESRDATTGGHIERVAASCCLLAKSMNKLPHYSKELSDPFIELLYLASPLHDIGKTGIPDKILLKPGKLTAEEFEQMKKHTILGAEALRDVKLKHPQNQFIDLGITIALFHHERWDGSGYPFGLAGNDIPLAGRIVSLADSYDAMRSRRSYKEPYTHEQACAIIAEEAGKQFDPFMAQIFLDNNELFRKLYDEKLNNSQYNWPADAKPPGRDDGDLIRFADGLMPGSA